MKYAIKRKHLDAKSFFLWTEINNQGEWSKQMNSHLKSFYPDDVLNESAGSGVNKSVTSENLNNNSLTNSFSSPQSTTLSADSAEYDRKISMLTKKLRSYEKRRHKLVYESKQEQQHQQQQQQSQQQQPPPPQQSNQSEQSENKTDNKVEKTESPPQSQLTVPLQPVTGMLSSLASQPYKLNTLGARSGSFVAHLSHQTGTAASAAAAAAAAAAVANVNASKSSTSVPNAESLIVGEETKAGASTFYISTNDPVAGAGTASATSTGSSNNNKFNSSNTGPGPNETANDLIDEQNSSTLLSNKSYNALDRNMVLSNAFFLDQAFFFTSSKFRILYYNNVHIFK